MPNLVGIGNSQVPTNAMLGGLAYQDSVGEIDIEKIKAKTSDTALNVFVYDTCKDSDGGAWRYRTQDTSWYNEPVSDERGTRREFPSVAVIVVSSTVITIYDGDDPNLPMWMVLKEGGSLTMLYSSSGADFSGAVSALNGNIYYGMTSNGMLGIIEFVRDGSFKHRNNNRSNRGRFAGSIADRNSTLGWFTESNINLAGEEVFDIATKVFPNAPINEDTGLPIPTIAVATDNGTSVVKDDGSIVDITINNSLLHHEPRSVDFLGTRLLWTEGNNYDLQDRAFLNAPIPTSDVTLSHDGSLPSGYIHYGIGRGAHNIYGSVALNTVLMNESPSPRARKFQISGPDNTIILGCKHYLYGGLEQIHQNTDSPSDGILNVITTSYNTGWMHGDCQLAVLTDTDTTDLTGNNKITNGFDWSGASGSQSSTAPTGWTGGNGATFAVETGNGAIGNYIRLYNENNGGAGPNSYMYQSFTTVVGKTYNFSLTQIHRATIQVQVRVGNSADASSFSANEGGSFSWTSSSSNTPRRIVGTFKATATTTYITMGITSGTHNYSVGWDEVIVTEADQNRSAVTQTVNATNRVNDLHAYGTITKNPVATGAELVGYSFANQSSYLRMPHDTNIAHVGSGDFNVMGWFYNSPRGMTYFDIANAASPRFFVAQMYNSDTFWFYMSTGSGTASWNPGSSIESRQIWQFIACKRVGTTFSYSLNGKDFISQTDNAWGGSITGNVPFITLGQNYTATSSAATGQMALWRFSHSDISIQQVKKIYNDEKKLFTKNAKCTLYGSSIPVTAIAYDDKRDIVHAGTASGRSEFNGLHRINNTTTAVTTAISASNEFVAEQ